MKSIETKKSSFQFDDKQIFKRYWPVFSWFVSLPLLWFFFSFHLNVYTLIKWLTEWEIEVQKYELYKLRRTLAKIVLIKEDINLNNLWVQFK